MNRGRKAFRTLISKPDYSSSETEKDSESGSNSQEDENKPKTQRDILSKSFRTLVKSSERETESNQSESAESESEEEQKTKPDQSSSDNKSELKNEDKQSKAKTPMQKTVRTFLTKPIVTISDQDYVDSQSGSKEVQPMKIAGKPKSYRDLGIEVSTGIQTSTNNVGDPFLANEQSDLPQNLGGMTLQYRQTNKQKMDKMTDS